MDYDGQLTHTGDWLADEWAGISSQCFADWFLLCRVWLGNDVICGECAESRIFWPYFCTAGENRVSSSIFIYSNGLDVHFNVTAIQYLRKHTYPLTEDRVRGRKIDNKSKRWCLGWIPLFEFDLGVNRAAYVCLELHSGWVLQRAIMFGRRWISVMDTCA